MLKIELVFVKVMSEDIKLEFCCLIFHPELNQVFTSPSQIMFYQKKNALNIHIEKYKCLQVFHLFCLNEAI